VRHLGCFHSSTVTNNASINMGVRCLYCNLTYISAGISLGVVLLNNTAALFWVFWEPLLFSIVAVLIYITTSSELSFLFPTFRYLAIWTSAFVKILTYSFYIYLHLYIIWATSLPTLLGRSSSASCSPLILLKRKHKR
jgi:hypothetical protein